MLKNIYNSLIVISLTVFVSLTFAEENEGRKSDFPTLKGAYFGQKPPGMIPNKFAPGIVCTEKGWEAAISFSPDNKELFFTRRKTIEGIENRILYMKEVDGVWTKPEIASFGKEVMEFEALITPNGKTVLFSSKRSKPAEFNTKGDIWYAKKNNSIWSTAKYFVQQINDGWAMFVSSTNEGTLYFTGGYNKKYGVFKSAFIDGQYDKPEYLPKEINYLHGASHPFVAPDESYIIFDAQPDGMAKTDLYLSFKSKNGSWTKAVKLDETINATKTEGIPTVSPDGKYLFFHRESDIYWVDTKVLEKLKPMEIK
jgi:hypothetical protein